MKTVVSCRIVIFPVVVMYIMLHLQTNRLAVVYTPPGGKWLNW